MSNFLFLFYFARLLFPHGDLHLRIEDITQAISLYPDSLALYLSRGELYIQHEEYQLAEQDFQHCLQKDFNRPRVFEGLSKSLGHQAKLDSAFYFINQALIGDPASISALEWKARLSFLLMRYCDAAGLYEQLIRTIQTPSPSLYLDASDAWGECAEGKQRTMDILKEGIEHIGPLHVFYQELARKAASQLDFSNAILYQSILVEKSVNKSSPLFQRALLHEQAGNRTAAIEDLTLAIKALDELPNHKSSVPAMKQLRSHIESTLKRIQN